MANPNHLPAGSPGGGRFTSAAGASDHATQMEYAHSRGDANAPTHLDTARAHREAAAAMRASGAHPVLVADPEKKAEAHEMKHVEGLKAATQQSDAAHALRSAPSVVAEAHRKAALALEKADSRDHRPAEHRALAQKYEAAHADQWQRNSRVLEQRPTAQGGLVKRTQDPEGRQHLVAQGPPLGQRPLRQQSKPAARATGHAAVHQQLERKAAERAAQASRRPPPRNK